jgi:pyruvate formate lyase activating enzyme
MSLTGLIFDVKRFSVNDGPGIRTTIFFKGCPLACRWCHNPESRQFCREKIMVMDKLDGREFRHTEEIGKYVTIEEVMREIEKETIFYETSEGGVTFSGGEPLLQPDFLAGLATACHEQGIHTCLDTSGQCESELFKSMIPCFDLFLYDVKLINSNRHMEWTGSSNDTILNNLRILDNSGKKYILRVPLIPAVNMDHENTEAFIELIEQLHFPGREIHLLPYHPMGRNKLKRLGLEDTMTENLKVADEDIQHLSEVITQAGFTVKIGG